MFESRLELFKVIVQDYRESFWRSSDVRRNHGFFLCGQMLDFLHRLLRRIVTRECLPDENYWDDLLEFDFTNVRLLSVSQFMEKTEFRTKAMRAAKGRINVEREENKKARTDVVAGTVMGEMFNPHVDQGRAYIRYVCKEFINHPTPKFKSDLVVGLACFDYAVLFTMPEDQAAGCYSRLFHSFCVRGLLARELKNIHMDDYMECIDEIRFVYLDELHIGSTIEDMITFLSSSPELAKREQRFHVFKLCCLCLGHVVPKVPSLSLGSPGKSTAEVELSDIIEPLQSYLLGSSAEQNIFTSAESSSSCVELLDEFGDKALQPCFDAWASVDFHGQSQIYVDLTKAYKNVRVALNVETGVEVNVSPEAHDKLAPQRCQPAQRPRIDVGKTSKATAAKALAVKLRSSRPGTSGDCL